MKINVGIVGYGNLGKALESLLINSKKFNLVQIFSKRKLQNTELIKNVEKYKNKIDIMFLCCGSQNDLENIAYNLIKHFNTIDVYDNHVRLKKYINKMNLLSLNFKKVSLCALGWDPGIFSLIRSLFSALNLEFITTWGKGVSQGHTNAIKNIKGVEDALQFTLPNKKEINQFVSGAPILNNKKLHIRLCYVVANKENHNEIKQKIKTMDDYFLGYKTIVKFVELEELNRLKTNTHKGEILTRNNTASFKLKLMSNPLFTAQIMLSYAVSTIELLKQKKYGAFSILDIPIRYILEENEYTYL